MEPKRRPATAIAPATGVADANGKKAAAGASASAADLKKGDDDWVKSPIKEAHLDKHREEGMLPPVDQLAIVCRRPRR